MTDAPRYTQSQVLYGLREAWSAMVGFDLDEPFDAHTRLDVYLKSEGVWDELDFADVFRGLERFFDFSCSDDEWLRFFGFDPSRRTRDEWEQTVAPQLTFGALSKFIAERAIQISFRPVAIVDVECPSAGAFLGIQEIARRECSYSGGFGPSRRIIDHMRGRQLEAFWTQVRWITQNSIPELPSSWREVTVNAGIIGCLGVVAGFIAGWLIDSVVLLAFAMAGAASVYLLAATYKHLANPLPPGIVTFRDLSMMVADSACDAVVAPSHD